MVSVEISMTAKQIPQHISQQFQHELEGIRSRVLEIGRIGGTATH
jgi:hypothetical protein